MRVVVALGENALHKRGEPLDAGREAAAAALAARELRKVAREHTLVVTHLRPVSVPLDVLDAESEGMIGYVLEQALSNAMPDRDVVTLLTRVRVDEHDLGFLRPNKPVGPLYPDREAALVAARGSAVGRDGDGWRRMIASPQPLEVIPLHAIATLIDAGAVVICAGGGGIPVARDARGVRGVAGVIDKDAASALLAVQLEADVFVMCTDQPGVFDHFGQAGAEIIRSTSPEQLRRQRFAPGSMGPKVDAAARFVAETGGRAAIGALEDAAALVSGTTGTQVRPDSASR